MKIIKIVVLQVIFSLVGTSLHAQLDPSFRQNQFNALVLNPAQAGANKQHQISLDVQKSWVGVSGSPKTINATGNFNVTDQLGLGIIVMNDEIGPVKLNRVSLSSAYHLQLSKKWFVSMGLSGMVSNVLIDLPSLSTAVLNDPHMQVILNSGTQLRVGFGGLLYRKNFYIGVSKPLLGRVSFTYANMSQFIPTPSIVAYTGGSVKMNKAWDFRPNVAYRYVKAFPLYLDATAMFTYNKKLDFGLTYQVNSAFGALVGLEFNRGLYVGYTYTYPTTRLNTVSTESHEVCIRMKFGKAKRSRGFQNPRFFN